MNADFWAGLATGLALIVAIGSQNAFVLRCGIRREHVLPIVLFCAASDALLIAAGVGGAGALLRGNALLMDITRYGGALFLASYGLLAARRALAGEHLYYLRRTPQQSQLALDLIFPYALSRIP